MLVKQLQKTTCPVCRKTIGHTEWREITNGGTAKAVMHELSNSMLRIEQRVALRVAATAQRRHRGGGSGDSSGGGGRRPRPTRVDFGATMHL